MIIEQMSCVSRFSFLTSKLGLYTDKSISHIIKQFCNSAIFSFKQSLVYHLNLVIFLHWVALFSPGDCRFWVAKCDTANRE